ncbi:MAG: 3'(2'),5'-bisphosphate nucleotidase CysQ [Proteobacteria bacterium]|nr:3'(2'),5'-bisphosphate nucleotidase CysQ [Pseudomonadota bacterium]
MNKSRLDLDSLAPRIISLAEKAGTLICQIYTEEVEVFKKEDGSPVTRADHQSHDLLEEGLRLITPDIPIISEEDEGSWKIVSPYYWLIDPLDGTKGFIRRSGEFCINIALMKDDRPLFGLIHIPLTQETYYGYDRKAWRSYKGRTIPIHTRIRPPKGSTLLVGEHGNKFQQQQDFHLQTFPIAKIERLHSAIKFCRLAAGQADIYIRFTPCKEWDTAAGHILVEAAGGVMVNLDGSPFIYGKPELLNEGFIVFGRTP